MQTSSYTLTALTPVLIVEAVEPSVQFWTNLGFAKENEVPGPDGKLIFASVKKDGVEIMYQSRASVIADDPKSASERQTKGAPVVKARHETFYGTTEFYIREPGGNVVGFSTQR